MDVLHVRISSNSVNLVTYASCILSDERYFLLREDQCCDLSKRFAGQANICRPLLNHVLRPTLEYSVLDNRPPTLNDHRLC